ncbi:MAG: septum site-determining protein MinC [Candidatus Endonucleobacter bathymodioli]|uniref:Probable septum site-determining protein MinC n=1 Tax=Candidatus Endonucleibacter bathymodioli TaxID=539814 RepID=A0AA90SM79_9GAMM|nr:septum site-determining protein MinC [Candidatus Endonucleobacter bathymodioli]
MTLDVQSLSSVKAFQMKSGIYTLTTLELYVKDIFLIRQQLQIMIQKAPNFFQQTPVIIALEKLERGKIYFDIFALRHLMHEFGIVLIAVRGGTDTHRKDAFANNIAWIPSSKSYIEDDNHYDDTASANVIKIRKHRSPLKNNEDLEEKKHVIATESKIIEKPVRSGQQVHSLGDLIVLGSVNEGAELLAIGNIHVYGHLRGRALAGINGNQNARIFCRQFEAELISICGQYKLPAHSDKSHWGKSVLISLIDHCLHMKEL